MSSTNQTKILLQHLVINARVLGNLITFLIFCQGPVAFEALFSQKVLPQSFGPLHLDDDDEVDFSMGKEQEAYGLQKIDLNRKIFTSAKEKEGASSSILMPEDRKDRTE